MSFAPQRRPVPRVRLALAGAVLASLAAAAGAQSLHTGVWWDPAESGWGLMVTDQGNVLAPYWYAPDEDGEPSWFVAPATRQADGSYKGAILRHEGVPLAQISGRASDPAEVIGEATLRFADGLLALDYTLPGGSASKELQRFNFSGEDIACATGNAGAQAASGNYTDLWYQPETSGWGLQVTHLDDLLHLTWYTYDEDREPVYFNGSGSRDGGQRFSGKLYRTNDGVPLLQVDGTPAASGAREVGSFTLSFSDAGSGLFEYRIGSVVQSRPVQRIRFGQATAVCEVTPWRAPAPDGTAGAEECQPPVLVGDLRQVRVSTTSNGIPDVLEREERVVGQSSFQGQPALVEEVSGETSAGTGVYARTYYAVDGGDEIATYGAEALDPRNGALVSTSVNEPLRIAQPRFASPGQVWSVAWVVKATAQGQRTDIDASSQWRYLGKEPVSTPAGTFDACKFETLTEVSSAVSGITTVSVDTGISWTHPAWGTLRHEGEGESVVQTPFGTTTTNTTFLLELLSASRNGQSTP